MVSIRTKDRIAKGIVRTLVFRRLTLRKDVDDEGLRVRFDNPDRLVDVLDGDDGHDGTEDLTEDHRQSPIHLLSLPKPNI